LEHEFLEEKNDMLESIRELTKEIKLKEFIISNFIPPKVSGGLSMVVALLSSR